MKPIFTAEIGMNADGNFELNYELIRQAALAGADIVKFQVGWRGAKEDINYLDENRLRTLKRWCAQFNVEFMASIITEEAWELVKKVGMDRFKIASRTVVDHPALCRDILAQGRETFISLGMHKGKKFPFPAKNARYLWCVSKYPTRDEDLAAFPARFDRHFGYSDHQMGIEACLLALSRGARLIEKHFTLNKSSTVIRDHACSAEPDEFRRLTELGRDLARLTASLNAPDQ